MGHVNPMTFKKLHEILDDIGFKNVSSMSNRETKSLFNPKGIQRPHREFYSLYVEAIR